MRIEKYQKDYVVTPDDFVLGTDGNNLNKTRNFPIWQLSQILLGQIKNSGVVLRYSDGSDPELPVGSNGYFFTNGNNTNKLNVTEFYISSTTLFGENVAALLNSVKDNLGDLYISLTQVDDASNYGYFNITNIEQIGSYYKVTANLRGSLYAKTFQTEQNYSVLFDLATNEYRFAFEDNKLNLYKNDVLVGSESLTINVPLQSRLVSGAYQGSGIVRFTRNDGSFFDVDQSGMMAGLLVTKTSQLQNDGDGTNPFLTDAYKTIVDGKVANLQGQITTNTTDISVLKGITLTIDQIQQKIFLKDGSNNELANISVAFLNNEGVKFKYDSVGKTLQLLDEQGNVLDSIPVSSFVSNIGTTLKFNSVSPAKLELIGNNGDPISEVTIQISNVAGLQAALDGKEPIIAVKNTAFNKDFGTTAGTVMEGNDQRVVDGATAFTWGDHSLAGYLKEADIDDIRIFIQNYSQGNSVVSFNAGYVSGYTYQVSATWIFDNVVYNVTKVITLAASDVTYDRFDLLALTFDGDIIVIQGTPAENPLKPEVDFETQLEGTFVLVQANTTAPADVNTISVYDERVTEEWSAVVTRGGSRINLNSAIAAANGTIGAEGTDLGVNDAITFYPKTPTYIKDLTQLNFKIKNKADFSAHNSNDTMRWHIYGKRSDGSSTSIYLSSITAYGYLKADTTNYQFISLPITQTSTIVEVTGIRVYNLCKSTIKFGMYLDEVKLVKLQETTNPTLEFATTEYVDRRDGETLQAAFDLMNNKFRVIEINETDLPANFTAQDVLDHLNSLTIIKAYNENIFIKTKQ